MCVFCLVLFAFGVFFPRNTLVGCCLFLFLWICFFFSKQTQSKANISKKKKKPGVLFWFSLCLVQTGFAYVNVQAGFAHCHILLKLQASLARCICCYPKNWRVYGQQRGTSDTTVPFPRNSSFSSCIPRAERSLHGAITVYHLQGCLAGAAAPTPTISGCATPMLDCVLFAPGDNVELYKVQGCHCWWLGPSMVRAVVLGWLEADLLL